jgi:hypothetical protein
VLDLLLGRGGIDDAVLAGDLLAAARLVLLLLLEEPVNGVFKVSVEALELALLDGEAAVLRALSVRFQALHLAPDGRVLDLRRRHEVVQLAPRGIVTATGTGKSLLVEGRDVRDVDCQALDLLPDGFDAGEEFGLGEHGAALLLLWLLLVLRATVWLLFWWRNRTVWLPILLPILLSILVGLLAIWLKLMLFLLRRPCGQCLVGD